MIEVHDLYGSIQMLSLTVRAELNSPKLLHRGSADMRKELMCKLYAGPFPVVNLLTHAIALGIVYFRL